MGLLDEWLEDKYTGDRPGDERFRNEVGEYHASHVGKCLRETFYKFTKGRPDDWSPYFELGNRFEDIYGQALKWKFGNKRVVQDVTCDIQIDDDIVLTGESDWVVISAQENVPDHVTLHQDGTRTVTFRDGGERHGEGTPIDKVVETKTTKDISWCEQYGHKTAHEYQVRTYMWAFDCTGEIAYMTRNELDEMVFDFERSDTMETDIELRVRELHYSLINESIPDADPPYDGACKWCDFKPECRIEGGTRWE